MARDQSSQSTLLVVVDFSIFPQEFHGDALSPVISLLTSTHFTRKSPEVKCLVRFL